MLARCGAALSMAGDALAPLPLPLPPPCSPLMEACSSVAAEGMGRPLGRRVSFQGNVAEAV